MFYSLVYRVPRVSPGATAPKLFSPTSVAGYAGPSFFLTDHPDSAVLLSEGTSVALFYEYRRGCCISTEGFPRGHRTQAYFFDFVLDL